MTVRSIVSAALVLSIALVLQEFTAHAQEQPAPQESFDFEPAPEPAPRTAFAHELPFEATVQEESGFVTVKLAGATDSELPEKTSVKYWIERLYPSLIAAEGTGIVLTDHGKFFTKSSPWTHELRLKSKGALVPGYYRIRLYVEARQLPAVRDVLGARAGDMGSHRIVFIGSRRSVLDRLDAEVKTAETAIEKLSVLAEAMRDDWGSTPGQIPENPQHTIEEAISLGTAVYDELPAYPTCVMAGEIHEVSRMARFFVGNMAMEVDLKNPKPMQFKVKFDFRLHIAWNQVSLARYFLLNHHLYLKETYDSLRPRYEQFLADPENDGGRAALEADWQSMLNEMGRQILAFKENRPQETVIEWLRMAENGFAYGAQNQWKQRDAKKFISAWKGGKVLELMLDMNASVMRLQELWSRLVQDPKNTKLAADIRELETKIDAAESKFQELMVIDRTVNSDELKMPE